MRGHEIKTKLRQPMSYLSPGRRKVGAAVVQCAHRRSDPSRCNCTRWIGAYPRQGRAPLHGQKGGAMCTPRADTILKDQRRCNVHARRCKVHALYTLRPASSICSVSPAGVGEASPCGWSALRFFLSGAQGGASPGGTPLFCLDRSVRGQGPMLVSGQWVGRGRGSMAAAFSSTSHSRFSVAS